MMREIISIVLDQLMLPLSESFGKRVFVAVVVTLVAKMLFHWNEAGLTKEINDEEVAEILGKKTGHWRDYYALVMGYVLLTGKGPGEGLAYTLPMMLYSTEKIFWLMLVAYLALPFLVAAIWRSIWFRRLGKHTVFYIWFGYLEKIGYGMLFGQVVELLARIIGFFEPKNGSLLYFVFFGLILAQIFFVGKNMLYFLVFFIASFFSEEYISEQIAWKRQREQREMLRPQSSGGSAGGGSAGGSVKSGTVFPTYIYRGGEQYRLQHDSGDHAAYYCPKTGETIQIWDTDLET